MKGPASLVMYLLEFTDSAFPVGTFSFSEGLETAAETGVVSDTATLEAFARDVSLRSAFTDGVAAMCAFRACRAEDYASVCEADSRAFLCKLNAEARTMACRTGRKAAELADRILEDNALWSTIGKGWLADIAAGNVYGTYAVTMAIIFACCGLDARDLFCAVRFGSLNTVLGAALRCVRVSHFDTQKILFAAADDTDELFDEASGMELDDMYSFAPQADILASLHEKGNRRMFMN